MLIIPAIDIIDSKVVRLTKGDFSIKSEYLISPEEQAEIFVENGITNLHIIDLNGSKDGRITVLGIIEQIKKSQNITIQFGGGIRKLEDIQTAFSHGVDKIIIGSLPITDRNEFEIIADVFPPDKIIIAADTLNNEIMVKGWKEASGISIYRHIEYCTSLGLNQFLCTDISRDGMLQGASVKLYSDLIDKYPSINLIASGGIGSIADLEELKSMNIYAAVIGKAIYENKIGLKELKNIA